MRVSFEELRGIAADIFRVGPNRIHRQSSPETIESWDSLQHLNLILALEQKFGLEFEPEEIERMTSLDAIHSLIEEKQLEQR